MNGLSAMGGVGILAILVGAVIGIAIAAALLMLATRMVAGFMPNFWRISAVVVLSGIASFVVNLVLRVAVGLNMMGWSGRLAGAVVGALIGAAILNAMVKYPDGAPLGYGKALAAEVIYYVIFLIIAAIMVAILGGMGLAAMQGMHMQ